MLHGTGCDERWGGLFFKPHATRGVCQIDDGDPVGVVLALGRRSKLPVIHWISMIIIELVVVCSF